MGISKKPFCPIAALDDFLRSSCAPCTLRFSKIIRLALETKIQVIRGIYMMIFVLFRQVFGFLAAVFRGFHVTTINIKPEFARRFSF
jgi:hypothetical protein